MSLHPPSGRAFRVFSEQDRATAVRQFTATRQFFPYAHLIYTSPTATTLIAQFRDLSPLYYLLA